MKNSVKILILIISVVVLMALIGGGISAIRAIGTIKPDDKPNSSSSPSGGSSSGGSSSGGSSSGGSSSSSGGSETTEPDNPTPEDLQITFDSTEILF